MFGSFFSKVTIGLIPTGKSRTVYLTTDSPPGYRELAVALRAGAHQLVRQFTSTCVCVWRVEGAVIADSVVRIVLC